MKRVDPRLSGNLHFVTLLGNYRFYFFYNSFYCVCSLYGHDTINLLNDWTFQLLHLCLNFNLLMSLWNIIAFPSQTALYHQRIPIRDKLIPRLHQAYSHHPVNIHRGSVGGSVAFELIISCIKWGRCPSFPDSTLENGQDAITLFGSTPLLYQKIIIKWIHQARHI